MDRIYNKTLLRTLSPISLSSFPVYNPSTKSPLSQIHNCTPHQTSLTITQSHSAFLSYRSTTPNTRSSLLSSLHSLLIKNSTDLATIITLENGKPFHESLAEVKYASSYIHYYSGQSLHIHGDILPSGSSHKMFTLKQPIGVCALITPWNFPLAMMARKLGAALAVGCTVVMKPSEDTPISVLALRNLCVEAGFDENVVGLVTCGRQSVAEIGRVMATHPLVGKVSFTGSTAVGKKLMELAAVGVKRVSLELGGNAPFIVFDDANVCKAVEGLMAAKFRNAGQTCIAPNRIFVHSSRLKEFLSELVQRVIGLKVGDGFDEKVWIGPLINQRALDKVESLVRQAVSSGATLICGGKRLLFNDNDCFYEPTILTNVTPDMRIYKEEIFGPVISIIEFDTEERVVEMANDTPFGLAAYFYSQDVSRIWRVAESLQVGMIGVNDGTISNSTAPFGGIKESGFGREGSRYGLDDFLNLKYISQKV